MFKIISAAALFVVTASVTVAMCPQPHEPPATPEAPQAKTPSAGDWHAAEKGALADQTQLTFADRFFKAGESYFSPDDSRVIFQAVEKPAEGKSPDEFYGMFVADVQRDSRGRINGLENIRRVSPAGSANTCGWFHPTDPNIVIFGSTIEAPLLEEVPAFERLSERYKWMFPSNMRVVRCWLDKIDGGAKSLEVLAGDGKKYAAECSLSSDGRHLLYCSLEGKRGDIYIKDLQTGTINRIVQSNGYDGGPFFSPDGKRICYRSDRRNEHYLQLYVADLAFNDRGEIVGASREYQLTDDDLMVHWCPFWTAGGRHLIYSSSELGHTNYEVFIIDADSGARPGSTGTIKYGTRRQRLTFADRADVLPALSHDGKTMIWTSQRGADRESQLWTARFVIDPDATIKPDEPAPKPTKGREDDRIVVQDPDTGRTFVYDLNDHTLSEYDMQTHRLTEVTDQADVDRFMELRRSQKQDEPEPQ